MSTFDNKNRWEARKSLWSATCIIGKREHMSSEYIETDTVIIGAGLAGVLTAYMLKSYGIETIVVEANQIGCGVTQNTTAKITSQHSTLYHKLVNDFGTEKAAQYARANEWAIAKYRQMAAEMKIDCDMLEMPSFLYTLEDEHVDIIRAEAEAASSLGIPAVFMDEGELEKGNEGWGLPFSARAAVRFDRQAQFHPLKFLKAVAADLPVFEDTRVLDVELEGGGTGFVNGEKSILTTNRGRISARNVVKILFS